MFLQPTVVVVETNSRRITMIKGVLFSILTIFLLITPVPCSSSKHAPVPSSKSRAVGGLKVGFYKKSCPAAESVVEEVVRKRFISDRSITAALLRMHYHDCFVRGCDASILIDSTPKRPSERAASPNLTVRGFDLIEEAKSRLESLCNSTVSCADVIVLATRDAVALSGGPRYAVPTGRRDSLVSLASDVSLPGPSTPLPNAILSFTSRGISLRDMVVLLGSHTVGVAHCSFFADRLHDPSMDHELRVRLERTCTGGGNPTVFLDQNTSWVVDNRYYGEVLRGMGVMGIDQALAVDKRTREIVESLGRDEGYFRKKYATAMVKMGKIGVLVGSEGEIRRRCNAFNSRRG